MSTYPDHDLRSAGTMALSNLSQAYQTFRNYSSDELHSLASGFQATFNAGSTILQSLLPNTPQGWLELGATIAIDLTPPGEAVAAGEMLTLGGEKLLQESFHILQSRSIMDVLGGVGKRVTQKLEDVVKQISSKTGQTEEVVEKVIKKDLEESSNLLDPADKSGQLTKAGRAAQKHGSRTGSVWPQTSDNPQKFNEQYIDNIRNFWINSSKFTVINGNSLGGFDIYDQNSAGLRFDQNGNFKTFLEP